MLTRSSAAFCSWGVTPGTPDRSTGLVGSYSAGATTAEVWTWVPIPEAVSEPVPWT